MKLLIVEDDDMNLKVIKMLIKDMGFDTKFAKNGEDAIQLLEQITPHLIISDIQMPKVDGIQLLEYIKSEERFDNTKVIAMTAHALIGDKERFLNMGFDEYISKPFDTRKFRKILEKHSKSVIQ